MDWWRSVSPKTSHVIAIRKIETPRRVARGARECGDGIFLALRDRVFISCRSEAESVSSRYDNRDTPNHLGLYVTATFGPNFQFTHRHLLPLWLDLGAVVGRCDGCVWTKFAPR